MAKSSFNRKLIGTVARMLHAIPVIRPQDLATKGRGSLHAGDDNLTVIGRGTEFTQQTGPRDLLVLSKKVQLPVDKVISDTEIKLKVPLDDEANKLLRDGASYKVIPHVDQSTLYDKVHERLHNGGCIVIFPEGGSHDQTQMLPLKAGFAIMALGAMAEDENADVKIVPVGLNYFHPHRFRSRAVVSYGSPISIPREWVEKYKQGGTAKREAIAALLDEGHEGLKSVTTNAPDYDTLMVLNAARRLYKPAATHKLTIDQVVDLNRRFLLGYRYFKDNPECKELAAKVSAYNNQLKYFGLHDHQVETTKKSLFSAAPVLVSRLIRLVFLAFLGFPSLIINSPLMLIVRLISQKKQKEALASSSVKVAARDVLASWKVIIALIVTPVIYGIYSFIVFMSLWRVYERDAKTSLMYACLSFVIQPFFAYTGIRLVETGLDLLKSLQPLIIAVCEPDAAAGLRLMREKLSDDVTRFVNEHGPDVLGKQFDPHRFDHLELRKQAAETWNWRGIYNSKKTEIIQQWFDDKSIFQFNPMSSTSSLASSSSSMDEQSDD
ncbi:hypothetical protein BC940DRAFT_241574 [Gongronella butleri]|nr:hypothetical protein BC940DRAFT_241574 [Gongronella butleri]